MTVHYRDDDVRITSTRIDLGDRGFLLRDLDYVWHRRTRRLARGGYVLATRVGAVLTALGVAAAGVCALGALLVFVDFGRHTWPVVTAVALVLLGGVAAAGFGVDPLLELLDRSHERGRGVHEIWARTEGREVLLLRTTDSLRFGRIYRALERVLERQR